jgi:hypothetical protein
MNFLNQVAEKYPGPVFLAAGGPAEELFDDHLLLAAMPALHQWLERQTGPHLPSTAVHSCSTAERRDATTFGVVTVAPPNLFEVPGSLTAGRMLNGIPTPPFCRNAG